MARTLDVPGDVISILDNRIFWLRWSGRLKLLLIVLLLIASAFVVWYAAQLAKSDVSTATNSEKLETDLLVQQRTITAELAKINGDIAQMALKLSRQITDFLQSEISRDKLASPLNPVSPARVVVDSNYVKDPKLLVSNLKAGIDAWQTTVDKQIAIRFIQDENEVIIYAPKENWFRYLTDLQKQPFMQRSKEIDDAENNMETLGRRLEILRIALQQLQSQKAQRLLGEVPTSFDLSVLSWPILIQTNVTRVGILVIVSFLVAILVPLYRSDLKLAAWYQGQRDALNLLGTKATIGELESLTKALTPRLEFGKNPTTPIEQIIDLLRNNQKAEKSSEE